LIQTIQTTRIDENHFYINVSKQKSILSNSLLIKINYVKLNYTKINYSHRQTKHTLI
jgi:RNA binding exosome subunit